MRIKLIATLVAGTLLSFNAQALDLLQVYQEALANDPVYASARYSLAAGQESSTQGRAGLLPAIGISGGYNRIDGDSVISGIETSRDSRNNQYTISLRQPLFNWANWQQYQQSQLAVAASEAQFAQAQQDLVVRVSEAYFNVLAAQDTLASVQAQKSAITEQLASAKRNFEVGTATITDTHEAQARYDLAVAQEFAAQSEHDIRRAALEQIIGRPAGELASLRPGMQLAGPQPAVIDPWVQSAHKQNYGVIGQELAREIAQREISRLRSGHLPTVDLVASRSHNNQRGNTITAPSNVTDSNAVGVQWNIPLFAGFAVTSQVREAIALADRARADLETARRNAAQAARQSFLGVSSGLAQVKALEAAEVSSRSALESNLLGYQVGVRINIDVLNAQQQLFVTRRDLARARYDTLLNSLRLKSAAGVLKEEDLVQVNSLLAQGQSSAMASEPSSNSVASASHAQTDTSEKQSASSGLSEAQVLESLNGWARAWSERDADAYLSYYVSDFKTPRGQSRAAWEAKHRANFARIKHIEVKIDEPKVSVKGNTATVKFRQGYASDDLNETSNKTVVLVKKADQWKIVQERSVN